ncbi:MAG: hypothetical protein MUR51_09170 [Pseudomonadota bacterium]|nr:hypothetical protein [Pseudomonadota bacterium]
MSFFKRMHKPTLFLWVLLLSVAQLCAQGVKLHVHSFGHDHESRHSIAPEVAAGHLHQSGIHLTTDLSHADHHDEVISEQGLNSQVLLKKITSYGPMLAIFVMVFTFLLHNFNVITLHRRRDKNVITVRRYILSPPLRAPPV